MNCILTLARGRCWAALLVCACGVVALPQATADTIYLKDGRTLFGVIEPHGTDENKVMFTTSGSTVPIVRSKIERIESQGSLGYTETAGDLAAAEEDWDRALDLYRKALLTRPENNALKEKLRQIEERIEDRDRSQYGKDFRRIEGLLEQQRYQAAMEEALAVVERVRAASAKERFNQLAAQAHIGIARQYKDRVDYPRAEEHYREARSVYPEGAQATLELAKMLQLSPARKTSAIPLYREGIELAIANPDDIDPVQLMEYEYDLAQLLMQEKEYSRAAEIFLRVAEKDENMRFSNAIDMAVEAYENLKLDPNSMEMDQVIRNLESILAKRPNDQRAYLLLGRIYFEREDWEKSNQMLASGVELAAVSTIDPALDRALYYLGISQRRLGRIEEAARVFERLVSKGDADYQIYCELGEIRNQQALYDDAKSQFEDARELDADRYRAYLGLGNTLLKMGEFAEARENFREVVDRDDGNIEARLAIAMTYSDEENWDQASDQAKLAIEKIESRTDDTMTSELQRLIAEAWTIRGDANLSLKNSNQAREQFKEALHFVGDYAPALSGIGRTLQWDKQYTEATKYFEQAIAAEPDNPDHYLNLAINYHKYIEDLGLALTNYYKYLELGGKDPNVRTWIVDCGGTPPPDMS